MPKLIMNGNGTVEEIANKIKTSVLNSGGNCKVVEETNHQYSAYQVKMMMFEKHYGRSSNEVYLTVLVTGANDVVVVDAVATEGTNASMLSRFSWGMEEDYIYILSTLLASLGFEAE